ncbi:putative reverse transcriptase domain-containing protein [Tanacetum coccineum]
MEILLEPTSNKLMVEHAEFGESNANKLERFYTLVGNPIKEILLKLNLPDHRILKDGGEVKEPQERCNIKAFQDNISRKITHILQTLNPIASTRWISAIEGAFHTSSCKENNKVNFALNFLRDSAKMWWDGKKDLLRKKNKEAKETKMKLKFGDRVTKKPTHYHGRRGGGTQTKTPCKKCHKTHLGECRANLSGCYKCGALNHMSKDCKKPMILCYNCNQLGYKSNKCPNPKEIEAKHLKSIKEEKVEKAGVPNLKACVYVMAAEEDKLVHDVVTCTDC